MVPDIKKYSNPVEQALSEAVNSHHSLHESKSYRNESYLIKVVGDCALCERKVMIEKVAHKLCKTCLGSCMNYLMKIRGFYREKYLPEAIHALSQPIPCRFFEICGQYVPKFSEGNLRFKTRKRICGKCMPIYVAGLQDSRLKTVESIMDYKLRKAEYEKANKFSSWESRPRTKDDY